MDLVKLLNVNAEKVTTIYLAANPIHSRDISPEEVEETVEALQIGRGFVLVVGTLEPRKNIPMLLNAYKQLRMGHRIAVPLILVGSRGWLDTEIFQTIGQLGLDNHVPVSYTHLRAHETVLDLVCRLLLEKKKQKLTTYFYDSYLNIN